MAATLFFIFLSILAMAEAVPETSECYYGPVYGPLVNTLVKYQTIFVERLDLAQMKSGTVPLVIFRCENVQTHTHPHTHAQTHHIHPATHSPSHPSVQKHSYVC
jgi:hypothetical protein